MDDFDATKNLLEMLIAEKDYAAAASALSKTDSIFESCSAMLKEQIRVEDGVATVTSTFFLQLASHKALAEISSHLNLLREVMGLIPAEDERDGLTQPLQQAMVESAIVRANLMAEVNESIKLLKPSI